MTYSKQRRSCSSILATISVFSTAFVTLHCGKKKSQTNSASPDSEKTITVEPVGSLNLTGSFDSVTPSALKASATSLNLSEAEDACNSQYPDRSSTENKSCQLALEIKQRFFQSGPTVIRDRLKDFEGRLTGTLERSSDMYVPCLNPLNTQSQSLVVNVEGGSKTVQVPAYSLFDVPLKTTFSNGQVLNVNKTLSLSCLEEFSSQNMKFRVGFGKKSGVWSLYQEQSNGMGSFGTVDASDSIDLWMAVGDRTEASTLDAKEATGTPARTVYAQSTGLAHIIAKPNLGVLGISLIGSGVGPGCGSQLIVNDSALYFKGNINSYGRCFATDFDVNGTEGPAYSASLENVELCLVVSGSLPEKPTDGLEHCIKSGLISKDDAGQIADPFAPVGLKELTADNSNTGENTIFARAWMAPNFMANTNLADVPGFYSVAIAPTDKIEKKGSQSVQALFKRTSVGQKIQLEAACNAASDQKRLAFEDVFKLDVQEFLQESVKRAKSTSQTSSTTNAVSEDTLFESLKEAFAATGDSAPFVDLLISRSQGTTFRAGFEGSYDLKIGGKSIKSAALSDPKSSSDKFATTKIDLAATTLEKNSVLELKITGFILHQCDNSNDLTRRVTLKPGLPRVVWFQKSKNP